MKIRQTVLNFFLFTFVLCHSVYAQADSEQNKQHCSDTMVKLVGKHLGISDFSHTSGVIVDEACKVWPKDDSKTIAIFSYDAGVEHEKRLIVVLVDTLKERVVATYKRAIQEDAAMTVGAGSFRIDTARYDLAPGVRAFGLDVTTSYSQGCVDGGLGPVRTLFVQDGKEIRPIFENFYISSWRYVQGGPSCAEGENVVTEDITYSIGIGNETTNGYANLKITADSSYSGAAKTKRKPFQYELHYDGKKYPTSLFNGAGTELDNWRRE
jgi:hypothetical protein